jgi:hypothetical protein
MSAEAIRNLVRSGEVDTNDVIRKDTSAQWMKIGAVPQLAAELPKPLPDELGLHEAHPVATRAHAVASEASSDDEGPPKLKKVDVTMLLVLSAVTLGIYGMIWFFGVIKSYRGITRRKEPNLELLFWVYLGCGIMGVLLTWFVIGLIPLIGATVIGAIILSNLLKDRAKIKTELGGVKGLTDTNILLGFWIAGQVLWLFGFPFAIYQAYAFASDHNKLVAAAARTRPEWVASTDE